VNRCTPNLENSSNEQQSESENLDKCRGKGSMTRRGTSIGPLSFNRHDGTCGQCGTKDTPFRFGASRSNLAREQDDLKTN
jgi:hypothetical protein